MAKWLARESDVLILDEPTRGVDIGAKEEIYRLILQIARAGKAVMLVSSEAAGAAVAQRPHLRDAQRPVRG